MSATTEPRYALGVLTAIYTLNLVDRGLLILLLEPIKADLHLSDTQLGFVTGIAFALFYATLGLPIARWADHGNRVTITSLSIALWSLTVVATLLVTNFGQLVLARVAAAIGEAGCKPPTYALVGDYFPARRQRPMALAIYFAGAPLASLFSFLIGGWLNERVGWRATFAIMGVPGLLLAVLVKTTVREPRIVSPAARLASPPLRAVLQIMWRRPTVRHLAMAVILLYCLGSGLGPWYGAFLIRTHGIATAELGLWLGLIFGAGGLLGMLAGGRIVEWRWSDAAAAQLRFCAWAHAVHVPCFFLFLLAPSKNIALAALLPLMLVGGLSIGPTWALVQRLMPNSMRATTLSLLMLLANLLGMGLVPQLIGMLSDAFASRLGSASLQAAMLLMATGGFWAAWHFWRAARSVDDDLLRASAGGGDV